MTNKTLLTLSDDEVVSYVNALLDKNKEQAREIERLKAERDEWRVSFEAHARNVASYCVQLNDAKIEIERLKALTFRLYCSGYEAGHNDTVEGMFSPPSESPEEFAEILAEETDDET